MVSDTPRWLVRVFEVGSIALRELPGSHSPFYSRPAELAELLMSL